jgi:hypothetical protein
MERFQIWPRQTWMLLNEVADRWCLSSVYILVAVAQTTGEKENDS